MFVPCEVFCLANYTTRASQTHYNVVINEDDYQDPDEDEHLIDTRFFVCFLFIPGLLGATE